MDIEDKLSEIESGLNAQNQATEPQIEIVEQTLEENKEEKSKMTQEQANAVMDIAKNPQQFIGVKISQEANKLINEDETVQKKFTNVAKSTVHTSLETYENQNKKQDKKNYFDQNKRDIIRLGADSTSTKGQQMTAVVLSRIVWFIIMATIGGLFIVPSSVLIEFFQGLSYRKVEEKVIENQNKLVVSQYKLGKFGISVGVFFAIAWCGLLGTFFYFNPMAIIFSCSALAIIIAVINIYAFIVDKNKLKDKKEIIENATQEEEI